MNIPIKSISDVRQWVQDNTNETPMRMSGFFRQDSFFSRSQIELHSTESDGWALDEKSKVIYNITPLFDPKILGHPGIGHQDMRDSLQQRLGGLQDISVDLEMHRGPRALALWDALRIGKLDD